MKINGVDAVEFVNELRERWQIPGVATGIRVGNTEQYLCSGFRCVETGEPIDEETILPVGSVTKSVVAHAVSRCVNSGLLDWNVPVARYVPDLKFADPAIQEKATLADFLSMRTGLANPYSPEGAGPRGEAGLTGVREEWRGDGEYSRIKALAKGLSAAKPFRQSWAYSGFSVAVAAMVLEIVAGRTWTDLLKESFNELGMDGFAFCYEGAARKGNAAIGYQRTSAGCERQPWPVAEEGLIDPGGSLCLSVRGLLTWLGGELNDGSHSVLFEPLVTTRLPDVPLDFWPESYGLCWGIRNYRGHRMIYHRGSEWGFRCVVAMIPDAEVQIAIVSNRHRNLLIHLLLNHLLDEMLGHGFIPWEPLFEAYARQTKQE